MDSLARHYSDSTLAFAPRKPSRLGPGHGLLGQRGTVSLPTSPLLSARHDALPEPPTSAAFFSPLPDAQAYPAPEQTDYSPQWFNPYPPSSSSSLPLSLPDFGEDHGQAARGAMTGLVRKKRAQVRIACTHCQKACKKCSNTRPCERCVKYGLRDCVDSTRKPRKTGVKRGPYKRRNSGKYEQAFFDSSPVPLFGKYPAMPVQPATEFTPPPEAPQAGMNGCISPPDAAHPAPDTLPPLPLAEGTLPGPRTAALHGAFAEALNAPPRWIHGQRTLPISDEVMYPPTPVVPFPISLGGNDDPFSRAVSPIHGEEAAWWYDPPTDLPPTDDNTPRMGFTDPWRLSDSSSPGPWDRPGSAVSDGLVHLKNVRKPSLRTLMSHGGSLAPSRQTSPVTEDPRESPTLFNQPMDVEDGLGAELGWGLNGGMRSGNPD